MGMICHSKNTMRNPYQYFPKGIKPGLVLPGELGAPLPPLHPGNVSPRTPPSCEQPQVLPPLSLSSTPPSWAAGLLTSSAGPRAPGSPPRAQGSP